MLGSEVQVSFDQQSNYVCLRPGVSESLQSPETTKQRTEAWHNLRRGAKVTGSTPFRTIGCSTLKEHLQHYDKVCLFCVYIDTFLISSNIGLIFKLYELDLKIANITNEMLHNGKGHELQ